MGKITEPAPSTCNRKGWPHEDFQAPEEACVCILPEGHDGLHLCGEGCLAYWAGGDAQATEEGDGRG